MRKLLGYRLKEECEDYRQVALKISNTVANWENTLAGYDISIEQTNYIKRLKQAGVMHWFEEVYEEEKFKVGDIIAVEKMHSKSWLDEENYNKILKIVGKRSAYASGMLYTVQTKLGKKGGLNGSFRHANKEEKEYFYDSKQNLNGKTATIYGIDYELKLK